MIEFGTQVVDDTQNRVAINLSVDLGKDVIQVGNRSLKEALLLITDARAPDLLETLALKPHQIGLVRALRTLKIGPDNLLLAGPQGGGKGNQSSEIFVYRHKKPVSEHTLG